MRTTRVAWPVPTAPFLALYFAGMHAEAQQVEHPERLEPRTRTSVRLGSLIPRPAVHAALRQAERIRVDVEAVVGRADLLMPPTLLDLPGGAHDLRGLPIGAQLVARTGREDLLLSVAAQLDTR